MNEGTNREFAETEGWLGMTASESIVDLASEIVQELIDAGLPESEADQARRFAEECIVEARHASDPADQAVGS